MEMNFREYVEAGWGGALGAATGAVLGGPVLGWPLAAAGAYYGNKFNKWYNQDQQQHQQPKVDPKFFVYYRDIDGRVIKELLPNEYIPIGREYEQYNADKTHPYFYYGKTQPSGQTRVVKRTKAGYQNYQRQSRQYGGYQRNQQQAHNYRYGQYRR